MSGHRKKNGESLEGDGFDSKPEKEQIEISDKIDEVQTALYAGPVYGDYAGTVKSTVFGSREQVGILIALYLGEINQVELTIEKNLGETLYRQLFYPCKTLKFYSKCGKTRTFVEYTEATDYGTNIFPNTEALEVAVANAVLKLIAECNNDFFFDNNDSGVKGPIYIGPDTYWLKYEDITEQWPNHYRSRLKKPLVGFKTVSKDGQSVCSPYQDATFYYSIGETYSVDEEEMLEGVRSGFYFSPFLTKALNYVKKDERILLVVASGLVFVKNAWDDLSTSNLTIVKELSHEEIDLLNPPIHKPAAWWNGYRWDL